MLAVIPALLLLLLQAGAGSDAAFAVSPETRVAWVRAMLEESDSVSDAEIAIVHRRPKTSLVARQAITESKATPVLQDPFAAWPETATEDCRRPRDGPSIA